jgi:AhpD family alkylhydroperoxidase
MQDWNKYRVKLMNRISDVHKAAPEIIKGVTILGQAGEKQNLLGAKVHELIALAVGVTTRCDGCIAVHVKKAKELGATEEEIAEALGVAVALNAGAALTYSARVIDALRQLPD